MTNYPTDAYEMAGRDPDVDRPRGRTQEREDGAEKKERARVANIVRAINSGNYERAAGRLHDYIENYNTSHIWTAAQRKQVLSGLEKVVGEKQPVTVELTETGITVTPVKPKQ